MKRSPLAGAEAGWEPGLCFSWDLVVGMEWGRQSLPLGPRRGTWAADDPVRQLQRPKPESPSSFGPAWLPALSLGLGNLCPPRGRRQADEKERGPVRWTDEGTRCQETLTPSPDACPLCSLGHAPRPLHPRVISDGDGGTGSIWGQKELTPLCVIMRARP